MAGNAKKCIYREKILPVEIKIIIYGTFLHTFVLKDRQMSEKVAETLLSVQDEKNHRW